ncbi:hypothetical protein [Streptomyces sp. x-80]|uniref:hypothetical protein n=1 Tax=Streptomyces sp. x-80 TaxID=2789282 RepID=UPI00397F2E81
MSAELSVGEIWRTVVALGQVVQATGQGINGRLSKAVSTGGLFAPVCVHRQCISDLSQEVEKGRDACGVLEWGFEAHQLAEGDRHERERQARRCQMVVQVVMGLLAAAISAWVVVAK